MCARASSTGGCPRLTRPRWSSPPTKIILAPTDWNFRKLRKEIEGNRRKSKEIDGAENKNSEKQIPNREVNYILWPRHICDEQVAPHKMRNGHKNLTCGFFGVDHFMLLSFYVDFLRFPSIFRYRRKREGFLKWVAGLSEEDSRPGDWKRVYNNTSAMG